MSNLNLILHCGANNVTREDVVNSFTPEADLTAKRPHVPVPHIRIVNEVERNLRTAGLNIVSEAFGLTHDGNRFFGMMELACDRTDYSLVCGFRNSHDKSFSAGLAMGSGVFVCDNLSFNGEIKIARKHTRNILRDLPALANKAIGKLHVMRRNLDHQIAAYKEYEMTDDMAKAMVVDAVRANVIPNARISDVVNEYLEPSHDEFADRTMWSLFNAFTEHNKGIAYARQVERTQGLHTLCDARVGFVPELVTAS